MFTLIVTGSSRLADAEIVWSPLWWMVNKHEAILLRHSGAPIGAERYAHDWVALPGQQWNARADSRLLVLEQVYDQHYGQHHGVELANQEMVDAGADGCFTFPEGRHKQVALDCAARAWCKGIPVYVFNSTLVGCFHQLSEREGENLAHRMLHWGS